MLELCWQKECWLLQRRRSCSVTPLFTVDRCLGVGILTSSVLSWLSFRWCLGDTCLHLSVGQVEAQMVFVWHVSEIRCFCWMSDVTASLVFHVSLTTSTHPGQLRAAWAHSGVWMNLHAGFFFRLCVQDLCQWLFVQTPTLLSTLQLWRESGDVYSVNPVCVIKLMKSDGVSLWVWLIEFL